MYTLKPLLLTLSIATLAALAVAADDEKKDDKKEKSALKEAAPGTLLLVDAKNKEHKVKAWSFEVGTRRLGWLPPGKDEDKDKAKDKGKKKAFGISGPRALYLREGLKYKNVDGVETLILLDRLRAITFDPEEKTMTVVAASGKDAMETLQGTTRYRGINKVTIAADVDKGDAGVASITFQGGSLRANLKAIYFPVPKVEAEKPGRPAVVLTTDDEIKATHKVSDLMPLYATRTKEKTSNILMFRKTLKLDVSKIKKITAGSPEGRDIVWRVTQKDEEETSLTLLQSATIDDQLMTLIGFVGKVPVGYKLFPLRRIATILYDTAEAPKETGKDGAEILPDPSVEKE